MPANHDSQRLPASVTPPAAPAAQPAPGLTVLYDGSCPLCRREIALYRGLQASQPLCFADVSDPAMVPPAGTSAQALRARFHVRHADGRLDSGARAFLALWAALPGWRWLARLGAIPGVPALMEGTYRAFLRVRPALQRAAARLEPRPGAAGRIPPDLLGELRSDHAGETGAVMIYRGVLAVARDPALRDFAARHQATEQRHLALVEDWLAPPQRSRLLGPWRVAGWLTGALPALCGARAVYATIAAVETFVDHHYQQQIDRLEDRAGHDDLRQMLIACQADERHHRDEAAALAGPPPGPLLRAWCALVGAGSSAAVVVARRF
jgi:demethoxyubiquinone hydroxylase (CLK1/Coq7/Cat5 family)